MLHTAAEPGALELDRRITRTETSNLGPGQAAAREGDRYLEGTNKLQVARLGSRMGSQ